MSCCCLCDLQYCLLGADSLQQLDLKFEHKEQAIEYCKRQGIQFEVREPNHKHNFHGEKDYGDKFLSKYARAQIDSQGEKWFTWAEPRSSKWVNLHCNDFGSTTWQNKEDNFRDGRKQPRYDSKWRDGR